MKTFIVVALVGSSAAWAQGELGCNKDTDCKGDRICVSGQCVSSSQATPQQPPETPPPQQYPQQQPYPQQQQYPPQQYPQAQPYPQQGYPQQQPYYPPQPEYRPRPISPLILGISGMVGLIHETFSDAYGVQVDAFGELGLRLSPGSGIVAWADLNAASYGASTVNGTATTVNTTGGAIGLGMHFGQTSAVTLGIGPAFVKSDFFPTAFGGVTLLGHASFPLAGAFSLHAQAEFSFFPNGPFGGNFSSAAAFIGLGFAH